MIYSGHRSKDRAVRQMYDTNDALTHLRNFLRTQQMRGSRRRRDTEGDPRRFNVFETGKFSCRGREAITRVPATFYTKPRKYIQPKFCRQSNVRTSKQPAALLSRLKRTSSEATGSSRLRGFVVLRKDDVA